MKILPLRKSLGNLYGTEIIPDPGIFDEIGLPMLRKGFSWRMCFWLFVGLTFLQAPAGAQNTAGMATIVGTVTDATGAVIPGAKITISVPDKGFVRDLRTNSAGIYRLDNVPIGACTIIATAQGFKELVRSGIVLSVGQVLGVDLTLQVGSTNQQVTVTGNVAHVQTETSAISDVVTGSQVTQLDLNGRNFIQLATLVPGAVQIGLGSAENQLGAGGNYSISFNGLRSTQNSWMLDGAPFFDETSNNDSFVSPSVDSIAEFREITSNYEANLGRHAGAYIEAVTKAGTKEFHGDAYEFVRNDSFDANDWFANRVINAPGGNAPKTPLKQNNYGFTLGGPIYIPGVYNTDKSKTYFFISEEWQPIREGLVLSSSVPSALMRKGNFSQCDKSSNDYNPVVASGCSVPINPATGQKFPGDIVPVDANAQALVNALVPLPNNGPINWTGAPSLATNYRQDLFRIDQNISDRTSAFFRYVHSSWETTEPGGPWSFSSPGTVEDPYDGPGLSEVFQLVHSFKPNLVNQVIVGWERNQVIFASPQPGAASVAGSLDRPSNFTMGRLFSQNTNPLLPGISIAGGTPFSLSVDTTFAPWQNYIHNISLQDNLDWTSGKHSFSIGVFAQRIRAGSPWGSSDTQGFLTYTGGGPITTTNALADMYLGRIQQYTETSYAVNGSPIGGQGWYRPQQYEFEPYFADDWKVTRRLILNLGVRYYWIGTWSDRTVPTNYSNFYPSQYNPAVEANLTAAGTLTTNPATGQIYNFTRFGNGLMQCASPIPAGCQFSTHRTVGPRFGFAYDLTGHGTTVLRGGWGIFYDVEPFNDQAIRGNPPNLLTPSAFNTLGYQSFVPGPLGPASLIALPSTLLWPMIQQYNLNFQHQFGSNNFLSVAYVGDAAAHLSATQNINQVPDGVGIKNVPALAGTPGCNSLGNCNVQNILIHQLEPSIFFVPYSGYTNISLQDNPAHSNYNSLQINFRHTTGYGLTFQAAYTWSHELDDATSQYFSSGVDDTNVMRWYGNGDINVPQELVMNYIYDLPFFKNSSSRGLKNALGGWEISGITSFLGGTPINFGCGILGMSSGIGQGIMCNSIGHFGVSKGTINDPTFGPTPSWFNPGTIGQPTLGQLSANNQPGMFGYMGRNVLQGPGRNNWDIALLKNFQLPWSEHSALQFRWETFNAFNHPQWAGVNVGCSSVTAPGQPCNGLNNIGNGEVSSAYPPRIMQFALKFTF
jgi:hypothetical protein